MTIEMMEIADTREQIFMDGKRHGELQYRILENYSRVIMNDESDIFPIEEVRKESKEAFKEYIMIGRRNNIENSRIILERYLRIMGYRNGKPHNEPAFSN